MKPLDAVDWMACCFVKFCIFEERLDFTLLFEVPLPESVDEAWRDIPTESTQLVVKTIDLKAAYKQFPIFPDHRKFFILVLKSHTGAASRALTSMMLLDKSSPLTSA